jgi:hypothetical protein
MNHITEPLLNGIKPNNQMAADNASCSCLMINIDLWPEKFSVVSASKGSVSDQGMHLLNLPWPRQFLMRNRNHRQGNGRATNFQQGPVNAMGLLLFSVM